MGDKSLEYYKKYEPFFGNWYLKEKVGEGSFGEVFKIEREDFGIKYVSALKVVTIPKSQSDIDAVISEGMDDQSAKTYFKSILNEMVNEISLMARLKGQSNIVSCEDHLIVEHEDSIGWDIFIRMELLTPLRIYQKDSLKTEKEVIQLGIDMCSALELCDRFNIIHRDIKPENIFISDTGNFKLGDFGIARTAEKSKGASTKVGTSNYMAPEVFRGETYSRNVDYYSLGLVLHRLLNDNRGPFYPPAPEVVTYQVAEEAKKRRISGEEIPNPINGCEEIGRIIRKASAYNPDDRYASAAEMKKDLTKLLYQLEQNESDAVSSNDKQVEIQSAESKANEPVTQQAAAPVAPVIPKDKKMFCSFCGKDITSATEIPKFCRFCGQGVPQYVIDMYLGNTGSANKQEVVTPAKPEPVKIEPAKVEPEVPKAEVVNVANEVVDDDDEKTMSLFAASNRATEEKTEKPEQVAEEDKTEKPEQVVEEEKTEKPEQVVEEEKTEKPEQVAEEDKTEKPEQVAEEDKTEKPEQVIEEDDDEKTMSLFAASARKAEKKEAPVEEKSAPVAPLEEDDDEKTMSLFVAKNNKASDAEKTAKPAESDKLVEQNKPVESPKAIEPGKPIETETPVKKMPRIKFCRFCGKDLSIDANPIFCRFCGKDLRV